MRRLAALAIAAGCLGLPLRARACAGCSNPNLPVGGPAPSHVAKGRWHASVALTGARLRVVHESRCPDIGPVCRERDEPPNLHDQLIGIGELRAVVEYGLTDRVGLRLQAPFKLIHTTITYRRLDGTAFVPDWEGIHHRDETLAGLTDPWLTARLSGSLGGWDLAGRLGLSIPLGRTEPNPFKAGLEGRAHQHFQFGTGTVNPVLGGEFARRFGAHFMSGYVQALIVPCENARGFRAGHRVGFGTVFGTALAGELRVTAGLDVAHEEAERWDGEVQQDGNLGRTDVLAGLGVSHPMGAHVLSLNVRTPVYQRVIGGQVSYPAIASLGVERTFGAP